MNERPSDSYGLLRQKKGRDGFLPERNDKRVKLERVVSFLDFFLSFPSGKQKQVKYSSG